MKKLYGFMLLCATMVLSFPACSESDEGISIVKSQVVGTWDVVWAEQYGESMNVPSGYIYMTLNEDGTYRTVMFDDYYVGTYELRGSTVVGTTLDPIVENYKFISLEGKNASIDYSNSIGAKYKFKAVKR